MDAYQKGPIIGEGTYGSVICATHKASGKQVAIKKVRMCNGKEGINMSVLRELKALKALRSPHVVELLDVFTTKNSLVLVFEYMEWSLEDVIRDKSTALSAADIKSYMQMLLQGLAFVHAQDVAHRDVKPDNMLIGNDMMLKLADFGLARSLDHSAEGVKLTPQVFGRWYRPPELLMGCCNYGTAVDMWAAGCVLAELLLRKPWFPGVCDMDQLDRIFKALGVPTLESWPGLADLPHRIDFKPADGRPLEHLFPQAPADCLDLLKQLMQFDPQRRISAAAALQHPYFSSSPAPTPPSSLPRLATSRAGRRNAAMVPALMHDMLLQPALMLRQQQQDGSAAAAMGNSASSRQLFAFPGHSASFSGRFLGGQNMLQPGFSAAADSMCGGGMYSGNSYSMNGGSRLCRGGSIGTDQLSGLSDDGPSLPWKGRLSFGSVADEPIGPPAEQEQQQQQQLHKRPSPLQQQQQQQQQGKTGSMRPPLHRNSLAGQHGSTPLPARPGSAGAAAMGSGDTHAQGGAAAIAPAAAAAAAATGPGGGVATTAGRRRVSDLAAALSSAAAGVTDGLGSSHFGTGGFAAGSHMPQLPQGHGSDGFAGVPAATPTMGAVAQGHADAAAAAARSAAGDADMACPMSMSTGAHKRSRAVYESALAAGQTGQSTMQRQGSSTDSMQDNHLQQQHQHHHQQQQQYSTAMSVGGSVRRTLRGRRSSMGSGCCSMDMDGAPPSTGVGTSLHLQHQQQQQQLAQVQELPEAAAQHGVQLHYATDDAAAAAKQQELEALIAGHRQHTDRHQHQQGSQQLLPGSVDCVQQGGSSSLQMQHPWPLGAAADPTDSQQQQHVDRLGCKHAAAAGSDLNLGLGPMHQAAAAAAVGLQQDGLQDCPAQAADTSGCPMSLDQRATTGGLVNGRLHNQQGHYAESSGMKTGCSSAAPCTGGVELHALDPVELAEAAAWWRPRLDSAERRYLRTRKQQMDEALLQASQHDDEQAADNTFGSPEFYPRSALFGSPLDSIDEQQHQQQQQHQAPAGAAAALAAAGTVEEGGVALSQGVAAAVAAAAPHEVVPSRPAVTVTATAL